MKYQAVYESTIKKVQELLSSNPEWVERYRNYINKLSPETLETYKKAQQQFSVPEPFKLYMPLSTAVNKCTSRNTVFELRFHGQSVAELYISNQNDKTVFLKIKGNSKIYDALESAKMDTAKNRLKSYHDSKHDWHSDTAKEFRKIYKDIEATLNNDSNVILKGQPEHELESALLQNYAQKSSKEKDITYIQPVMMKGTHARFQMPTPLGASKAKDGPEQIKYSNQNGGGIDILARMGSGRSTTLAVMELKDQNIDSEPPEKAIMQAIAYAVFLRELLRSDCGQAWWTFFGFGGNVPEILNLKTIIVMPNEPNAAKDFANETLSLGKNGDKLTLGYIYLKNSKNGLPQEASF